MKRRMLMTVVLALAGLMAVTACSPAAGISALGQPAGEGDQWPGESGQLEGLDEQSVRLLASHEGAKYFVVAAKDQQTACLYKFEEDSAQHSAGGCGAAGGSGIIVEVKTPSSKMMLVREDADTAELEGSGWTRIHENIVVA